MANRKSLVLVIEDDPAAQRFISRVLELHDYRVIVESEGGAGLDRFTEDQPDLVLLDIGLPDLDGLEVCREIRAMRETPIIMVTSRAADQDVVRGLEPGADDYLVKPFSASELAARVMAVLRRSRPLAEVAEGGLQCGELLVDFAARRVTRSGQVIHLTPTEYSLLVVLGQHAGKVLTSSQIPGQVWGAEYASENQILRTHIGRLRRKIEPEPENPILILTEQAVGYWLNCHSPQSFSRPFLEPVPARRHPPPDAQRLPAQIVTLLLYSTPFVISQTREIE